VSRSAVGGPGRSLRAGDLVQTPLPEAWRPRPEPVYDPRIVPIVMPDLASLERFLDALRNYRPEGARGAGRGHR
jgi:hypothetical protein